MSKRVSSKEPPTPIVVLERNDDGSPPGTAVDFILQTMIARASAPGKRQIRPKNVDALLNADIQEFGSDEDPDFIVSIESDEDNDSDKVRKGGGDDSDDDGKGSMDGNAEDTDDEDDASYDADKDPHVKNNDTSDEESENDDDSDDSNSSSGGSSSTESSDDDSQSPVQKRSALRETLQKLKESEFAPQKNRKRKRPRKAAAPTSNKGRGGGGVKKEDVSSTSKKSTQKANKTAAATNKKDTTGDKKTAVKRRGSATSSNNKKRPSAEDGGTKDKNKDNKANKKKKKSSSGQHHRTITDMVLTVEKSQKENRKEIIVGSPICSACLGKTSDEMNEIVECDSCGITVHEGCYGVSDTLSVSSGTGSSCSTEPWFCDACRTGATYISCELCPMQGGLYKETTAGRWVHLVCALYTPGVVITDSGLPSLFDIPYPKWGAQLCSLCDNSRFSRSGICIACDAGMCKTYLHATCAQKHGLLSDPILQSSSGLDEVDPFFAACKLHTNRETSKRRAKCFAVLQEQLRIKQEQKLSTDITEQERINQNRIRRKLERIRFRVAIKQAHSYSSSSAVAAKYNSSSPTPLTANNLNACMMSSNSNLLPPLPTMSETLPGGWKEGNNKKSRLLPTSAGTAMAFLRKAMLMGLDVKALELEDKHSRIVASVKKKWNVPAGLSVEYAAYYADRENRISGLTEQCEKLEVQNSHLNNQQIDLQNSYDRQFVHNQLMDEDTSELHVKLVGITSILKTLCTTTSNKKLVASIQGIETKTDIQGPGGGGRRRSPSKATGGGRQSPSKGLLAKKAKKNNSSLFSPTIPSSSSERLAIKICSVCDESDEQPWIICCDNCKKLYHLKCLDPPLTRLPKRSKQCGWMCSDCGEEELEAEEATEVDTEAPRTLRGRTKIRKPGKYRHSTDSKEDGGSDRKLIGQNLYEPVAEVVDTAEDSSVMLMSPNIKVKLDLSSPTALANGTTSKSPKRKRKSDNSIVINSPPTAETSVMSNTTTTGPTKKPPRKRPPPKGKNNSRRPSKENPNNVILDPSAAVDVNDVITTSTTTPASSQKVKKPRVRKPKVIKTEEGAGHQQAEVALINDQMNQQGNDTIVQNTAPTGYLGVIEAAAVPSLSESMTTKNKRKPKTSTTTSPKPKAVKVKRPSSVKVPRPRPPKVPKIESTSSTTTTPPGKNRKKKESASGLTPTPLVDSASSTDQLVVVPPNNATDNNIPNKPKRKRPPKKSAAGATITPSGEPTTAEQLGNTAVEPSTTPTVPVKKPRKPKKSLAELQKIMMAAATVAVKKGDEQLPSPVVLTNGKFSFSKKRKSSVDGGGTKEKSIPPKKRKRVSAASTNLALPVTATAPHESSHQDDVINAVASGLFEDGSAADMQMNGISRPSGSLPDGVLMQGVAPVKSGWNNNTDGMIKGQTMSSCNDGDVVTVNASDLIDCVLNTPPTKITTTAVSSYSPGFYSSSTPSTSGATAAPNMVSMVGATDTISSFSSSTTNNSNLLKNNPTTSDGGEIGSTAAAQTYNQPQQQQQESQNQNVIKLIYESSDTAMTTNTLPALSSPRMAAAANNNIAPQQQLNSIAATSASSAISSKSSFTSGSSFSSNSLSLPSSEHHGTCFSCNKEELKKNMVTCDKCAQDFHFMCLTPPLMYSPRRRNYAWYCSTCDELSDGQAANTNKLDLPILPFEQSTPSSQQQQQSRDSRLTVHLFEDEIMKNYMKKFQ